MNRHIASSHIAASFIGAAAAAAVAIIAVKPGNALAESTAEYTIPFAGNKSRAGVQADLAAQRSTLKFSSSEWSLQDNQPTSFKSSYGADQVKAEFKAARREVSALTAEDSGSAYLAGTAAPLRVDSRATLGGPAR